MFWEHPVPMCWDWPQVHSGFSWLRPALRLTPLVQGTNNANCSFWVLDRKPRWLIMSIEMPRSLFNYFVVEQQSSKIKVMCSQMQWGVILMSQPFFHSGSCSVRTKLIIHSLLAVFVSTLMNIQTGISSGNLLFKLLGWNVFTVWQMPDGIKTFSTRFRNGRRVDHYNLTIILI